MFKGLDHVVIAVDDLEKAIGDYQAIFGREPDSRGEPEGETYRNAVFRFDETMVELITPKSDEGPVAKRLVSSGQGMYLMAMRVDDVDATVAELRGKGVRLIGDPGEGKPVTGQVFIHPSAADGVLLQIIGTRE